MNELALDGQRGDRRTKQAVVYSLCGIAWAFALTVCWLAIHKLPVPEALDRLVTFLLGTISGVLAKTAADKATAEPIPVTTPPGQPLETTDVPAPSANENEGKPDAI